MARANVARRHGDDFQARQFWLSAASLLDPNSPVTSVAYETGPKSFDDITVEYDPDVAPRDHEGKPIYRRHIQCKWHTKAGTFGYADLIDPVFINAQRYSLLQKAQQAQEIYAPNGVGCQFKLVTNWRIKADDPLLELVRKESDALDLVRLFDSTTDASRMGRVRTLWREHLKIDHTKLELVARTLAVAETLESLASQRERLDDKFISVGLKRVPACESGFLYDDLIVKLLAQGRVKFDRDSFVDMARSEGILDEVCKPEQVLTIGVRSFMHPIDNLEDRCQRMLDLVPNFDGRYIRNEWDWQQRIYPDLREFVLDAARTTDHLRVILDVHVSLAFAVGALINVKSGKHIEIEQRSDGRRFWSMNDTPVDSGWLSFLTEEELIGNGQNEIAVAVGLTHDISRAVSSFVRENLNRVGRIIHFKPEDGASQQSVRCGHHAWMLSEVVMRHMQSVCGQGLRASLVHIFVAGPNGFAFFLGQHQQALGPTAVYEWDFDGQRGGYSLGLSVGAPHPG